MQTDIIITDYYKTTQAILFNGPPEICQLLLSLLLLLLLLSCVMAAVYFTFRQIDALSKELQEDGVSPTEVLVRNGGME